jgi:UDPglucose 6-dehydrogenase
MNLVNAELAKLSVNAFVTMKISFANTLAALCERLPEGDVDAVTTALGHDSRIGPRYLKGGIGYGGPCFPRDNRAFSFLASQLGERAFLADATDALNRTIVGRLARHVKARAPRGGNVAVLGMSYKPSSNVVEASQGLELAVDLASEGFKVAVYDPAALDATQTVVGDRIRCADSVVSAIQGADVVVVANPDPAFRDLPPNGRGSGSYVVIDAWRLLRQGGAASCSNYVPLGVGLPAGQPDRSPSNLWQGYVDASAAFAGADVGQ